MALFGKASKRKSALLALFFAASCSTTSNLIRGVAADFPPGFNCAQNQEGTTGSAQRYIAAKPDVKSKVIFLD
jgi:hypothetical protein